MRCAVFGTKRRAKLKRRDQAPQTRWEYVQQSSHCYLANRAGVADEARQASRGFARVVTCHTMEANQAEKERERAVERMQCGGGGEISLDIFILYSYIMFRIQRDKNLLEHLQ